ncbi:basic salivary proline-rich protein 1, partial [Etheostoma spectabile]|uniref:basic salivary proline-rich protein 1 n=1 Tax=Etheostoma spectabile TaxID=54343 RepID=UPI0013AF8D62
ADQRRKWDKRLGPNPVRPSSPRPIHPDKRLWSKPRPPSSPRPIHRRIPAAASQSGFPPGTDAGSSAGKPLSLLDADQQRKGTRDFGPNPVQPSSPRPIHRRIPAAASQSGFPPDTDAGSSAGKPLSLLDMALNNPQPLWDGPKPQWVKNMEVCMERRKVFGGWHKSATQPAGKPDYGFSKPRPKTPYGSPHFYSFSPFPSPCCSPCGSESGSPSGSPLGSNPGSLSGPPCGSKPGCPCGPPCGSNSDSPCGSPRGSNPGLPSGPPCGSDPGCPSGSPLGSNPVSLSGPPCGSNPDCQMASHVAPSLVFQVNCHIVLTLVLHAAPLVALTLTLHVAPHVAPTLYCQVAPLVALTLAVQVAPHLALTLSL